MANGMSIDSAVFAWVPNAMLYNALSMCKKTLPGDRPCGLSLTEEDRATDIGNMHKNLVTITRVVPEISSRTDRQTYSSQYFATAPAGEVIKKLC